MGFLQDGWNRLSSGVKSVFGSSADTGEEEQSGGAGLLGGGLSKLMAGLVRFLDKIMGKLFGDDHFFGKMFADLLPGLTPDERAKLIGMTAAQEQTAAAGGAPAPESTVGAPQGNGAVQQSTATPASTASTDRKAIAMASLRAAGAVVPPLAAAPPPQPVSNAASSALPPAAIPRAALPAP